MSRDFLQYADKDKLAAGAPDTRPYHYDVPKRLYTPVSQLWNGIMLIFALSMLAMGLCRYLPQYLNIIVAISISIALGGIALYRYATRPLCKKKQAVYKKYYERPWWAR